MDEKQKMNEGPSKEWFELQLAPPVNVREKYGNAFEFSPYEMMLMKLLEKTNG